MNSIGRIDSFTNFNPNKRSLANFSILYHIYLALSWKEKLAFVGLLRCTSNLGYFVQLDDTCSNAFLALNEWMNEFISHNSVYTVIWSTILLTYSRTYSLLCQTWWHSSFMTAKLQVFWGEFRMLWSAIRSTLLVTLLVCVPILWTECWHFCCSGAEDIELWFSEVENLLSVEDDSGKVGDEDRGNSVNIAQCTWRGWAWEEEQEVGSRMSFLESFQYFASYFKTFELNVCKGWTKCSCPTSAVVFWNLILNSFTALVSLFK